MPISEQLKHYLSNSSWIRRLFEEGMQMVKDSPEPVYDLTIGNPDLEPPSQLKTQLAKLIAQSTPGQHKYMSNVGYLETRQAVAQSLSADNGIPFTAEQIIMTVGAAGAINIILKTLLNPGDEVIILSPFFVEYPFYIDNHQGKTVYASTGPDFDLDIAAIEAAITDRTAVIMINNPNNPTGVVYPQQSLNNLGDLLRRKSVGRSRPIFLIDDAPYRKLIYDTPKCTSSIAAYENTLFATSHSKDLGIPGERIGFLAISPRCEQWQKIVSGAAFSNRCLGFVNAPALMQRAIAHLQEETIDIEWYRRKRDRLYRALIAMGYEMPYPSGAFYMFPKAPGGDDIAFIQKLKSMRVLVVPGSGFGCPGYFRLTYCLNDHVLEGALPLFHQAIKG